MYAALVATSDYTSSEVGGTTLQQASNFGIGPDLGLDPTLTSSAGRDFWIARELGTIIEIDPVSISARGTYDANDPGRMETTNPYDVAVAPDGSLWIARFGVPTLLVLNCDGSRRRTIDLSSQDALDGNPNMSSIKILDPATGGAGTMSTAKAYVALEILDDRDGLKSTRPSKLARIDLESGAVEDVLTLAGRNPLTIMVPLANELFLADTGTWCDAGVCPAGQPDSGVERVDTSAFTSKLLVTGTELGGHATEVAVMASCGAVIVAGELPTTPTSLVSFDPTEGSVAVLHRTVLPQTTTFTLQGIAWVGGDVLLAGDRGTTGSTPGIRLFDTSSKACSLVERADRLMLPQPPVGFVALR